MEGDRMNRYQKMNKLESQAERKRIIASRTAGYGLYVFKNHTKGELMLPKPSACGKRRIAPGQTFEGDNYFLSLVKSHLVTLESQITSPEQERADNLEKENVLMEQKKLLLDQPDKVTNKGKVEQVVVDNKPAQKHLTENKGGKAAPAPEVLLNEGPSDLDGIEIVQ
jgi:hypothetical protein